MAYVLFLKNLYLPREGDKVSGLKRVYLTSSKCGTFFPHCQKNQKWFVRVINYYHVILCLSFRFGKILIL